MWWCDDDGNDDDDDDDDDVGTWGRALRYGCGRCCWGSGFARKEFYASPKTESAIRWNNLIPHKHRPLGILHRRRLVSTPGNHLFFMLIYTDRIVSYSRQCLTLCSTCTRNCRVRLWFLETMIQVHRWLFPPPLGIASLCHSRL